MVTPPASKSLPRGHWSSCLIEKRNLASQPVPLRCNRCINCVVNAAKQFGAVFANKIKCARLYQAFQHLPICNAGVQTRAEILQCNEVASLFALPNYGFHGCFADVF